MAMEVFEVATEDERFWYVGKNPMGFAVYWHISVWFCGFRTPLTPSSHSIVVLKGKVSINVIVVQKLLYNCCDLHFCHITDFLDIEIVNQSILLVTIFNDNFKCFPVGQILRQENNSF